MKSEVFKTAWNYIRNNVFATLSEALTAAWKKVKLTRALRGGIAYFSFRMVSDGSTRAAIGTLHPDNFTYRSRSTGKARKDNPAVVKYYDVEKRAFRSFKIQNLLTIR